jgi:hypothetical protein
LFASSGVFSRAAQPQIAIQPPLKKVIQILIVRVNVLFDNLKTILIIASIECFEAFGLF